MSHYHFAYHAGTVSAPGFAFGCIDVSLDHPVRGPQDVKAVAREIQAQNPQLTNVVILSWQRYEEDEG